MRHYEIVFMVHPDQSEQVPGNDRTFTLVQLLQQQVRSTVWKLGPAVSWLIRSTNCTKLTTF
ncbi:30S ribosomal protein S6 [Klebsiella pneumoniae]|uniref:30S ribosomal protein S6 n=1 Tax=Klebsiella pneumoniae TaxID=573 RepID=A0A377XJT5_KLEPN|nr:30S ribosomal protein S6 [Klebsiella pneumoniae]